jgi:hypothetical protein
LTTDETAKFAKIAKKRIILRFFLGVLGELGGSKDLLRIDMQSASRFAILLIACAAISAAGRADEPLRWKFTAGGKLAVHSEQQMQLEMESPSGPIESLVRQQMDATWTVESVNSAGDATIVAKIDRIQSQLTSGDEERLAYDSASDETPTGLAAMSLPMFETMLDAEYRFTVSNRGEVRDFEVPDLVRESFEKGPGTDATGDAAVEAFKRTLAQAVVPVPENVPTEGQTWSARAAAFIPGAESANVTTEYRYEGVRNVDGTTVAVIRPTITLEVTNGTESKVQLRIEKQSTEGEILFDTSAGRLRSLEVKHHATVISASGEESNGTIEQATKLCVTHVE